MKNRLLIFFSLIALLSVGQTNTRLYNLTTQATALGSYYLVVDDPAFTAAKKISITVLNSLEAATRLAFDNALVAGSGLQSDGSYLVDATTNYLKSADFSGAGYSSNLYNADFLLDTKIKLYSAFTVDANVNIYRTGISAGSLTGTNILTTQLGVGHALYNASYSFVNGNGNDLTNASADNSFNFVSGANLEVNGRDNFILGQTATINGDNNLSAGNGDAITGNGNLIFGGSNTLTANGSAIIGLDNRTLTTDSTLSVNKLDTYGDVTIKDHLNYAVQQITSLISNDLPVNKNIVEITLAADATAITLNSSVDEGTIITFILTDCGISTFTFTDNSVFLCDGGVNLALSNNDVVQFIYLNSKLYQVSPSTAN